MWAGGLSAGEMADRALSWQPQDRLGIQWAQLPRFALAATRGFAGLSTGAALEQLFDARVWHEEARETDISLHTVAYNLDRGRAETLGSAATPELTLGELARIAVARPLRGDAVRVEGELYADGGVIDAFPAELLAAEGELDHVIGLNVALPRGLERRRRRTRGSAAHRARSPQP